MANYEDKLQRAIEEISRENMRNCQASQKVFVETVTKKDEQTKELLKMMMDSFESMNFDMNRRNEEQFQQLMTHLEKEQKKSADSIEAMEKLTTQVTESKSKISDLFDQVEKLTVENLRLKRDCNGRNLMLMVSQRQNELNQKYGNNFPLKSNISSELVNPSIANNQFLGIN